MSGHARTAKYANLVLETNNQSLDNIQKLVSKLATAAGCGHCGLIAVLRIDFLSDPDPETARLGVKSFEQQGLTGG